MNKITDGEILFFLLKLYERTSYEETLKRLEDSNTIKTNWQMEKNKKGELLGMDKHWKDKTNTVKTN